MDTVLDRAWTADSFLAWEDGQEGKHELDGRNIVAVPGGSFAHQDIVFNVRGVLGRLLAGQAHRVGQEMRLRIGERVRYPDVLVCAGRPAQATRTVTDAIVIVEVVSEDIAATDRVQKLRDYAELPSLGAYVLLEQTASAATLYLRQARWPLDRHLPHGRRDRPARPWRRRPAGRLLRGSGVRVPILRAKSR
jgi:Uma2 family endonuclease